jgi:hypothetical protein
MASSLQQVLQKIFGNAKQTIPGTNKPLTAPSTESKPTGSFNDYLEKNAPYGQKLPGQSSADDPRFQSSATSEKAPTETKTSKTETKAEPKTRSTEYVDPDTNELLAALTAGILPGDLFPRGEAPSDKARKSVAELPVDPFALPQTWEAEDNTVQKVRENELQDGIVSSKGPKVPETEEERDKMAAENARTLARAMAGGGGSMLYDTDTDLFAQVLPFAGASYYTRSDTGGLGEKADSDRATRAEEEGTSYNETPEQDILDIAEPGAYGNASEWQLLSQYADKNGIDLGDNPASFYANPDKDVFKGWFDFAQKNGFYRDVDDYSSWFDEAVQNPAQYYLDNVGAGGWTDQGLEYLTELMTTNEQEANLLKYATVMNALENPESNPFTTDEITRFLGPLLTAYGTEGAEIGADKDGRILTAAGGGQWSGNKKGALENPALFGQEGMTLSDFENLLGEVYRADETYNDKPTGWKGRDLRRQMTAAAWRDANEQTPGAIPEEQLAKLMQFIAKDRGQVLPETEKKESAA